eukprot:9807-Heterococcus_DN1.PRE.3
MTTAGHAAFLSDCRASTICPTELRCCCSAAVLYGRPAAAIGAAAAFIGGAATGSGCALAVPLVEVGESLISGASHTSEAASAAATVISGVHNNTAQCATR